jgi:hypothetical protein
MDIHLPYDALSGVSLEFLDRVFSQNPLQEAQRYFPKSIMSLVKDYTGSGYHTSKMENYKNVCEDPRYSAIFKASWVDRTNERKQSKCLRKILSEKPLKVQVKKIKKVLAKEAKGYKRLFIYTDNFYSIRDIIKTQTSLSDKTSEDYLTLEQKKNDLIHSVLNRMGHN